MTGKIRPVFETGTGTREILRLSWRRPFYERRKVTKLSKTCIGIVHGHVIDPINPDPDDIHIEDIAWSLSQQRRFTGHLKKPYSVAEHSVRVSLVVPEEDAKAALMHDSSEAYLLDVPSPLKNALFGDRYRQVEDKLMEVISEKFGFEWPLPESVVYADNALLRTENRDLMDPIEDPKLQHELWDRWFFAEALPETIEPMNDKQALEAFMIRYHVLFEK